MDFIPLCIYYLEETKGYESELVYSFEEEYNYQINFTKLLDEFERMTYLVDVFANITGGHFTIREKRKETIHFSGPILRNLNVFTITTNSKKNF